MFLTLNVSVMYLEINRVIVVTFFFCLRYTIVDPIGKYYSVSNISVYIVVPFLEI